MDGIMHLDSWEMSQDLDNARPGAPDYVIDEAYFRDRFDTQPWMMTYKRQQRDGPFWDRASLEGPLRRDQDTHLPHRRLVRRLPRQPARACSRT